MFWERMWICLLRELDFKWFENQCLFVKYTPIKLGWGEKKKSLSELSEVWLVFSGPIVDAGLAKTTQILNRYLF